MNGKVEYAIIYWKDAALHGQQQMARIDWAGEANLIKGVSMGFVVYENKEMITLSPDYFYRCGDNDMDEFRTAESYPKSGILKTFRRWINI